MIKKDCSPGPAHAIDSKFTRFGKDGTPQYSILGRQRDPCEDTYIMYSVLRGRRKINSCRGPYIIVFRDWHIVYTCVRFVLAIRLNDRSIRVSTDIVNVLLKYIKT